MWSAISDLLEALGGTPVDGITWFAGVLVVFGVAALFGYLVKEIKSLHKEATRLNENTINECRAEIKRLSEKIESNSRDFWGRYNSGSDKFRDEIKSINQRLIPVEQDCNLYGLTIKPMFKRAFQKKTED